MKADPSALLQQAFARHREGAFDNAAALYRQILALEPDNADALHLLALVLKGAGQIDEAMALMGRAVAARPDFADAHYNLGNLLMGVGRGDEAILRFRKAVALKPGLAEANYNLGNTLRDRGDLEDAAAAFEAAIAARPAYAAARHNLANVFKSLNRLGDAIAQYRRAIAIAPDLDEAHYNMSLALLLAGQFEEGLEKYEYRWAVDGFPSPKRNFPQPLWDGGPAPGKTLLIHSEQGLGDALQFCRYLPMIAGRAGRVVLECRKPLMSLFATLPGVNMVVEAGARLPPFDLHAPLLSLLRIMGTRMSIIPNQVPYLRADPAAVQLWRERRDMRFTVGLIWAGNKKPDPSRTVGLAALQPIIDIPGIRAVGLQKELEPGDQERIAALGPKLDYWGGAFDSFADTAAAMETVDLIVSIDTGAAHLAGALGRPSWVFLPFSPDWRWLMGRETSPWYPTMRLYRQERRGDWTAEIKRVAEDLQRQHGMGR